MYRDKRIAAIVVAAGSGVRMGGDIPKQYLKIGEEMILEKAINAFESHPLVDDIYLVVKKEDLSFCSDAFTKERQFSKIRAIISGGEYRQASVYNGLRIICKNYGKDEESIERVEPPDYVLIHDGVRPFVSPDEISRITEAAVRYGAAAPGIPVNDTVVKADGMWIKESPDRNELYLMQTPQGFYLSRIFDAHKRAKAEGYIGTDDTSLLLRVNEDVALVAGSRSNIKITTADDMVFVENYGFTYGDESVQGEVSNGEYRIGTGFDVHAFTPDRELVLGGIHIPWDSGLRGHSDADVLTHAIMDSLLGACGRGDIGILFPDNDPAYNDISSIKLLTKVNEVLRADSFEIGNIDGIVIAEKPKVAPYIEDMKNAIADALNIDVGRINIKATTTERLGFCGRQEGMAAMASAAIYKKNRSKL